MERGPMELGAMIDGRHRLERVLGVGGFATVYLGIDTASGREVAIKVLNQPLLHRARFEREIQAVSQLRDPHTVRLFTHGQTAGGTPFIIFEFVPGRDLEEVLVSSGPLPAGVVQHVLRQVLMSLREAHQMGVVHRDIKPANIRIFEFDDDPWTVKVLDFGIAGFEAPQDARLTKTGELLGTPKYMSPEQLLSAPMGPASDIYSLGVVALEMLVGLDEMHGSRWSDQLDRLQTGHLFGVGGKQAHLDDVLARMTARAVEDRFQSAEAVLHALDNPSTSRDSAPLVANESGPQRPHESSQVPVRPPTGARPRPRPVEPKPDPRPRPGPPTESGPSTTAIIAVGAVLALLLGVFAIVLLREDEPAPPPKKTRNLGTMLAGAEPAEPPPKPLAPREPPSEAWRMLTPKKSGCGGVAPANGILNRHIVIPDVLSDRSRTYRIRAPRGYDANKPYPVWLVFESVVFSPEDLIAMTGLEEFADEHGIVFMVFPKERGDTTAMRDYDEIQLVARALVAVQEELCIDRDRVYGFSHGKGGRFLRTLACETDIAAIATVGDWAQSGPRCEKQIPHIKFIGTDDAYSQPGAAGMNCLGEGPLWVSADVDAAWRENNACTGEPQPWGKRFRDGACTTRTCETPFVTCSYPGGHFFPDRPPSLIVDPCPAPLPKFQIVNAAAAFFEEISAGE